MSRKTQTNPDLRAYQRAAFDLRGRRSVIEPTDLLRLLSTRGVLGPELVGQVDPALEAELARWVAKETATWSPEALADGLLGKLQGALQKLMSATEQGKRHPVLLDDEGAQEAAVAAALAFVEARETAQRAIAGLLAFLGDPDDARVSALRAALEASDLHSKRAAYVLSSVNEWRAELAPLDLDSGWWWTSHRRCTPSVVREVADPTSGWSLTLELREHLDLCPSCRDVYSELLEASRA